MLTMTVIGRVKPEKWRELVLTLDSLYSRWETEKGLKNFLIYQEMTDPNSFRVIAEFESLKDLEKHLREEKFRVLLGALEVLCQESEIRYSEKTENVPSTPKTQFLLPESSWRRNLAMMQEEGRDILEEEKEKYP